PGSPSGSSSAVRRSQERAEVNSGAKRAAQDRPRPKPWAKWPRRSRSAEVEALKEVATVLAQQCRGRLVLYPFGDDHQPEAVAEVDGGPDDGGAVAIGRHVHDKGLVDLDLANREPPEVGQRGRSEERRVGKE